MAHSRLRIALPKISRYFRKLETKIFSYREITLHLTQMRDEWKLAKSSSLKQIIEYLIENCDLKQLDFPFPNRHEVRYTWGSPSILEILLTLKSKSYFTHLTALHLHGLTTEHPSTIYLNAEQVERPQSTAMEQKSIDAAFRNRARKSNNVIDFESHQIFMLNGKQTNLLGVITQKVTYEGLDAEIRLTDIERTLIDITVRPVYAGSIELIQKAYELAKDSISTLKLITTLNKLRYLYPYHQAIGYYLEQAGYDDQSIKLFEAMPKEYDFYLCNQIKNATYVDKWKLYVPKP